MNKLFLQIFLAIKDRQEGASAVEYGMLVALIAAVIVVTVGILGTQIKAAFETIVDALGGPPA
jgi:pilus assembly protein Flp/PilA